MLFAGRLRESHSLKGILRKRDAFSIAKANRQNKEHQANLDLFLTSPFTCMVLGV